MRVSIIGAGVGGLALAHGLVKAGIDVQVHERHTGFRDGLAGYGIHISADGNYALHRNLSAAAWQQYDSAATAAALDQVNFHTEKLHLLVTRDGTGAPAAADPMMRRRAVARDALRRALLTDLDGVVHWNRRFTGYRTRPDGTVLADFEDGSEAVADVLVAADGARSKVRRQRLPQFERIDTGTLNIAGAVDLAAPEIAGLPPRLLDTSVNNIVPLGPGWLFLAAWPAPPGEPRAGQLVWAYAAAATSYPDDVEQVDGAALAGLVRTRIGRWAPQLPALVGATDPATVSAIRLLTAPPLTPWTPSAVTVLGDAIHSMTPMAGVGANTALRDAGHLVAALAQADPADPTPAIGRYEARMRGYANAAVAGSRRNAVAATGEKAFQRRGFRAALQVAGHVAPLRSRMFPAPSTDANDGYVGAAAAPTSARVG